MRRRSGVTRDRGRYYWVKRVPKRFRDVVVGIDEQPVTIVRPCLYTDSLEQANGKAGAIEAKRLGEWEALLAGDDAAACAHREAARSIARAHDIPYRSAVSSPSIDLAELAQALLLLSKQEGLSDPGGKSGFNPIPTALPGLREILCQYLEFTAAEHKGKSELQKRRREVGHHRPVNAFLRLHGLPEEEDLSLSNITRDMALDYRRWWADRIENEGYRYQSARKDMLLLRKIVREWMQAQGLDLPNPFDVPLIKGTDRSPDKSVSRDWIRDVILAPGALGTLNEEARDVLSMMVNTGLGPSEILGTRLEDFRLDDPVPHLRLLPEERELKNSHRERSVPLLGISLEAARRALDRGGWHRYAFRPDSWSGAVNKFLRTNGLREHSGMTANSLRHSIDDALLVAGVDDRVRADIMGHKYGRPAYGNVGALEGRRKALELIAL